MLTDVADHPAWYSAPAAHIVRKRDLQDATWAEVDFENAVWSIRKERMKGGKTHNVYLSRQALDMIVALKTCAGNSQYLLPSRYDAAAPMSRAPINRITYLIVDRAIDIGLAPPSVAERSLCFCGRRDQTRYPLDAGGRESGGSTSPQSNAMLVSDDRAEALAANATAHSSVAGFSRLPKPGILEWIKQVRRGDPRAEDLRNRPARSSSPARRLSCRLEEDCGVGLSAT